MQTDPLAIHDVGKAHLKVASVESAGVWPTATAIPSSPAGFPSARSGGHGDGDPTTPTGRPARRPRAAGPGQAAGGRGISRRSG